MRLAMKLVASSHITL